MIVSQSCYYFPPPKQTSFTIICRALTFDPVHKLSPKVRENLPASNRKQKNSMQKVNGQMKPESRSRAIRICWCRRQRWGLHDKRLWWQAAAEISITVKRQFESFAVCDWLLGERVKPGRNTATSPGEQTSAAWSHMQLQTRSIHGIINIDVKYDEASGLKPLLLFRCSVTSTPLTWSGIRSSAQPLFLDCRSVRN